MSSRIEADAQLKGEFAFLIRETGWSREDLLWHLFWDADVMHIDDPMRFRNIEEETWPIPRKTVKTVLKNLSKLAEEIERVSATDFSPARTGILCNGTGERLPPKDEQYLLKAFRYLPAILAFYRQELNTKCRIADEDWANHLKSRRSIVDLTKQDSLYYEKIRKKTGRYHTDRLHRLLSVAREIRRLPPITLHAFLIWLQGHQDKGGRPRKDAERDLVQRKKDENKTWKQIAAEMNHETGQGKTPDAYRALLRSKFDSKKPEKNEQN